MEKLILNTESKSRIETYRAESHLSHYEPGILNEILAAAENKDEVLLNWFNTFGDSLRSMLMNVYAYRKGLEFGFNEIAFDKYGWFKRPEFLCREEFLFGNAERYCEYSTLKIGKGIADVWTNALSYNFGTAGGGCSVSVYGKQFKTREAAVNAGVAELKLIMTAKIGHTDTSNYKPAIILGTLKAIANYEVAANQLSLF